MTTKRIVKTSIVMLIVTLVFTIGAMASIGVKNGVIIGLDANTDYEYAQVTLANYTVPTYTAAKDGATEISGLSAGIWYIRDTSTDTVTAVWIEGDVEDRESIGDVYYSDVYKKDVVRAANAASILNFTNGV